MHIRHSVFYTHDKFLSFTAKKKTKSTVKLFFVQLTVSISQLLGLTLFAVFRPTVKPMEILREPKIILG